MYTGRLDFSGTHQLYARDPYSVSYEDEGCVYVVVQNGPVPPVGASVNLGPDHWIVRDIVWRFDHAGFTPMGNHCSHTVHVVMERKA